MRATAVVKAAALGTFTVVACVLLTYGIFTPSLWVQYLAWAMIFVIVVVSFLATRASGKAPAAR